jgi:hypothetical protein
MKGEPAQSFNIYLLDGPAHGIYPFFEELHELQ